MQMTISDLCTFIWSTMEYYEELWQGRFLLCTRISAFHRQQDEKKQKWPTVTDDQWRMN